jgi:hypothetical protein
MSADAADAAVTGATGADDEGASSLLDSMLEGAGTEEEADADRDDTATQLAHWKDMSRKHEKRAKENASAAARLREIEDANKTELQRALDAQAEAERERDEARNTHSRMMAAASNNLPVELIDFLGIGTDDEIGERAEQLANIIEETAQAIAEQLLADMGVSRNGETQQPQQQGARPVESLRAGSAPAGATPSTPEQWFRNLVNGQ